MGNPQTIRGLAAKCHELALEFSLRRRLGEVPLTALDASLPYLKFADELDALADAIDEQLGPPTDNWIEPETWIRAHILGEKEPQ